MSGDQDLYEFLRWAEVNKEKAKEASVRESFDDFEKRFSDLEVIVGYDRALDILKEGDFLDYGKSQNKTYFSLARQAHGQLNYTVTTNDIPLFYTIKSLDTFLNPEEEQFTMTVSDDFNLPNYRILHQSNEMSKDYLDALITDGKITVADDEHWCTSDSYNGPRGKNILKTIKHQLTLAASYTNLPRLDITINFGQNSLEISEETQDSLEYLKDHVYQ